MSTCTHVLPRRRSPRHADQALLDTGLKSCSDSALSLPKGATFHSPLSPSSPLDPVLHTRTLPSRALTSPKDLEHLVNEAQNRVEEIIRDFDKSISLNGESRGSLSLTDVLPVPSVFLAHTATNTEFLEASKRKAGSRSSSKKDCCTSGTHTNTSHDHASDSGLGTSIESSLYEEPQSYLRAGGNKNATSVYTPSQTYSAANKTFSSHRRDQFLDEYATAQIKTYLIEPLLEEDSLKDFHPLVEDLPNRIASKKIICLRDVEKTLIFLAEFKAKSPASYFDFCNFAIQCIHTTATHLNEVDQRRPTDRPYTNTYIVDLVEQVTQYARIMAITRQKIAQGQVLNDMDHKPDEKLKLSLQESKAAELVRERADGTTIAIDAGHKMDPASSEDSIMDADMERSMARKRKCDIGKVEYRACRECGSIFTRACDLTKHEKTHSRPWKCPETDCKYNTDGWPTEKERDRHVNDKHMKDAALFKCLYQPCAYSSKRESNCKQHMEKAHGWEYVRAKSKKGQKLVPATPAQKLSSTTLPTPDSDTAFPSLTSPTSTTAMSNSPDILTNGSFSPSSDFEGSEPTYSLENAISMTESLSPEFAPSLMDSHLTAQPDLTFDTTMSYGGTHYTSPDCPELLNTPGTGYNYSPSNPAMPSMDNFEFDFNLDATNSGWQRMQTYFPQWFPDQSASSFNSNGNLTDMGEQQMTMTGYANSYQAKPASDSYGTFTVGGVQEQYNQVYQSSPAVTSSHGAVTQTDFTLFTEETGYIGAQVSTSGSLFPELDLGAVGGQFGVQEESIYDEPMETDDKIMKQYMNFDDEADMA